MINMTNIFRDTKYFQRRKILRLYDRYLLLLLFLDSFLVPFVNPLCPPWLIFLSRSHQDSSKNTKFGKEQNIILIKFCFPGF